MHNMKKKNNGHCKSSSYYVLFLLQASSHKEAKRVTRKREKCLVGAEREAACPYPRNGGKPHSRMYVMTPAAQMSTLRPYLEKQVASEFAKSEQDKRWGVTKETALPF